MFGPPWARVQNLLWNSRRNICKVIGACLKNAFRQMSVFPQMPVFPRTYTEYPVPDRGRGIYKKNPSQYPAWSPWAQKNRFFSAYQGIYRKIVVLYPLFGEKRGIDTQFFCICPVSPYKPGKKGRTCETAGYCGTIILYIPCRIK